MKMKNVTPALVVLLCAACSTPAPEGEQVAAAETEERDCRPVQRATGSKMRSSECHSVAEWAAIDAQAKTKANSQEEFFRRTRESSSLGPGPSFPAATGPAGL